MLNTIKRLHKEQPFGRLTSLDGCGIPTFAFPLREIAWAIACLADPDSIPSDDPRARLAPHYRTIRAAMRRWCS